MRERHRRSGRLMVVRLPLLAIPLLLVLAACGSDDTTPVQSGDPTTTTTEVTTTTTAVVQECSTSNLRFVPSDGQGVPAAVAATRQAIIDAALACDYATLESLTGPDFNFSFGAPEGGPAAYWNGREAEGEPVLRYLVQVLQLPSFEDQIPGGARYVTWPSANREHRTQADWDALKGLYTDEQIADFQRTDLYTGYRVAIDLDGGWMYFVAGD